MTGREAFERWARAGARWVDWVRPVPFASMDGCQSPDPTGGFPIPTVPYIKGPQEHVAVIIDTPGGESIREGIALAKMGFRPIPLFNGTKGQEGAMALVDHRAVERALLWGAAELEQIIIPWDAPPAFLLDSNRTHRYKMDPSVFDNSWDLYPQDMPSAEYLRSNGIGQIIVRGETVQEDLRKILDPYRKKGIQILSTDGYHDPEPYRWRRRRIPLFRRINY